jgi:raffinose/stachyose/melibiose transport system substrate-binding protein
MKRFRFGRSRAFIIAAAVLVALTVSLVAGAATGGNIEVVSFYPEGAPDYTNLLAISKSFEASHPGSKVTLTFGGGQSAPNIVARWRAGNPPEVNVGFFGPGAAGEAYVDAGQVQDLTAAMNKPLPKSYGYGASTKWKDTILPAVKPWITMGNKYYAVPSEITAINFFYNRALFKKYNLSPPKTWAQFLNVCAVLKKNGVAPLTVTGTFAGYMQLYYDYLLARRVGTAPVLSAIAGKTPFSAIPGAVAAATDLQNLVKKGYFLNGFEGTDFTAAQLDFFQGRAGMILMGTWLEGEMKDSIPSGFALGTFAFPSIPGGKGENVLFGAVNVRTVASKSANPAQGIEFLKWFSRKDVQAARTNYLAYLSPFKGVKVGPKYQGVMDALQSNGGSFATDYFGIFGQPASVQNAYQLPIVKLMFQKESPADMVKEISDGLQSAQR